MSPRTLGTLILQKNIKIFPSDFLNRFSKIVFIVDLFLRVEDTSNFFCIDTAFYYIKVLLYRMKQIRVIKNTIHQLKKRDSCNFGYLRVARELRAYVPSHVIALQSSGVQVYVSVMPATSVC